MSIQRENLAPWQPCKSPEWTRSQIKHYYRVELGKMLQPTPAKPDDIEVPYLKSLHVQWNKVVSEDLPTMWANASDIEHLTVDKGDLLVCEGVEVGRAAIVEDDLPENCIIQNALHLIRPNKKGNVRFLFYLLNQASDKDWFDVICNRSTIAHFTVEKFKEMWVWIPQLLEQEEISNYLDQETTHIDNLIQAKENMLALLTKKRQALITQAVTRGLDPIVPLKPSGVEWLGDVPEHWEVERTRWLFQERNDRSETGEEEMLTVSHLTGVTPRSEKDVNMFEAESNEGYKVCYPGDLVINTLWAWMGAMGIAPLHGIVSPAYHVYTPTSRIESAYVDVIVRLPVFASEVTRYSKGVWSSRLRLYPEGFYEVYLPVPPLEEQRQIINHIKNELGKLNTLQTAAERTITLLKERRSALITAAVTGQIDIPVASLAG